MDLLYKTIIAILAIIVIILGGIVLRNPSSQLSPEPDGPVTQVRRIERMPEFETTMEQLGYKAWGYRWQGGMIDGVLRVGSSDTSPKPLGGKAVLTMVRDYSAALNKPSSASSLITGTLLVLVGPIPDDRRTADVPCRVSLQAKLPSGQDASQNSNHLVEFATGGGGVEIAPEGGELQISVEVFGKWNNSELLDSDSDTFQGMNNSGSDAASIDNLIELHWIDAADRPEKPNKAVNPRHLSH